jgi:hypothetical protein
MFCNKCGAELKDGSRFCNNCGDPVRVPAGVEQHVSRPVAGMASLPRAWKALIAIVVLVVVGGAGLGAWIVVGGGLSGPGKDEASGISSPPRVTPGATPTRVISNPTRVPKTAVPGPISPPTGQHPTPTRVPTSTKTPAPAVMECLLPRAGCEARVTNVQPEQLNIREGPGTNQEVVGQLKEGDTLCLVGSGTWEEGYLWWPVRATSGTKGWVATYDPKEPGKTWIETSGSLCPQGN